jgi:hypothetical protein
MVKIMKFWLLAFASFCLPQAGFPVDLKGNWELEKSELVYTVIHPLHTVHGKSLSAKGKGVCYARVCEFLVAVPVKSFDSGDNNRDLHMLQVVRAGTYPMAQVHVKIIDGQEKKVPKKLKVEAIVDFAGKQTTYRNVLLDVSEWNPEGVHLTGTLPLTLKDFDITPPSLLTIPIHNEIPVKMDMFWKHSSPKNAGSKKEKDE